MQKFKARQLPYFIESFKGQKFSGVVSVQVESPLWNQPRKRVILFHQGWMTYAGKEMITAQGLAKLLGRKLRLKVIDSAIQLANKKVKENSSIHDYLELLVRLELFQWKDVEAFVQTRLLGTLEQLIPYDGTLTHDPETVIDLYYSESQPGFNWADLRPLYEQRQQQWEALAPAIPSIEVIPRVLNINQADVPVAKHLRKWVDSRRSLLNIATALEEDPLDLAKLYYKWAKEGVLTCSNSGGTEIINATAGQPIVLSVDDSAVVQALIKRALNDRYQVLLAENAVDALNLLNNNHVSIILLDVTMPDIDGLELCRTIRSIGKFRELPVVMLTAKDGMFNKLKGQMAGATHYLTKPVTREKLLEVLDRYVPIVQN